VSWPVRTRICLECRTALSDGERCTWVRHTILSPSDPQEKQRLMEAVWPLGPPRPRPPLLLELGMFVRTWFVGPPLSTGDSLSIPGDVPPPLDLRAGPRVPRGASEEPLWTARTRYAGRVADGAPTELSPLGGEPCVAYGIWLLEPKADGSPILLRDGATIGFDVALDDGRLARIPRASADLVGEGSRMSSTREEHRLRRYLDRLFPGRGRRGERSHLPFRDVREAVVKPGDRVRLLADLESVPDHRSAVGSAYRESAGAVLSPVGRVVIELGNS
jgi:hypothetical protein